VSLASLTAGQIVVGEGGLSIGSGASGGPPVSGSGGLAAAGGYAGQGGGFTGLFRGSGSISQAAAVLIAGGGGGSGYLGGGGGGGGSVGEPGRAPLLNGTGGSQTAGGLGGNSQGGATDGSALQGGTAGSTGDSGGGGGGGGGFWGGGAGSNGPSASLHNSAGGGGSGYSDAALVTSAVLTAGSADNPGDSSSALRGTYGTGGAVSGHGVQGAFVLRYADAHPALAAVTGTVSSVSVSGGFRTYTWTTAGTFTSPGADVCADDVSYCSGLATCYHNCGGACWRAACCPSNSSGLWNNPTFGYYVCSNDACQQACNNAYILGAERLPAL